MVLRAFLENDEHPLAKTMQPLQPALQAAPLPVGYKKSSGVATGISEEDRLWKNRQRRVRLARPHKDPDIKCEYFNTLVMNNQSIKYHIVCWDE